MQRGWVRGCGRKRSRVREVRVTEVGSKRG
jgi:hypothetical protein